MSACHPTATIMRKAPLWRVVKVTRTIPPPQLCVHAVDAICTAAVHAGATIFKPPAEDPFGDRVAKLIDPCGHEWLVATRIAEVSPHEMKSRFAAIFATS